MNVPSMQAAPWVVMVKLTPFGSWQQAATDRGFARDFNHALMIESREQRTFRPYATKIIVRWR